MEAAGRPNFGTLLRQFRFEAGITQQELAERAKLSVEAIGLLERGARTRPRRETVALLGRALELTPERESLLASAVDATQTPRRRDRAEISSASLLSIVRPDTHGGPHHNLPRQLTSFVGRRQEVGQIAHLLREHRLVTVVGAGGVGKTRVAVQLGRDSLPEYRDGVWLVDLAPLSDQDLVASAVMTSLQLPSAAGSALAAVVAYLRPRRLVLILDNCEHVLERARDLGEAIGQSCPDVRVLATSREALGVPGERAYHLPSLAGTAARALFAERGAVVDGSFAIDDDNAADVAEICRRLDGIPLAIELAAARLNVLAPGQIAARLDERFRLLTGGDPRALPRHQTMTALIGWSYDLLSPREQRFFESFSVFAGSCSLDTATAVCAEGVEDELDVLDLVASLVTKSLLVAELAGREQRYRLLESSRQFAREKLTARGDWEVVARRHALAYVEVAQRLDRAAETMPDEVWLAQASVELENCRAALEWALGTRRDVVLGQRLATARKVMWRGFSLVEGRRWVRAALDSIDDLTPPALVAALEHAAADGAQQFGERKVALAAAERTLVRYRALGDELGCAQAQSLAGASLVLLGRADEAEPLLQEALEVARSLGERRLAANVLQVVGWARSAGGDFAAARVALTEASELANALGAEFLAVSVAASLAENEYDAGDPDTALRLSVDVLATLRALNASPTAPGVAATLTNMATYLVSAGRYDEARVHATEALELARGLRLVGLISLSLRHLVIVAILEPRSGTQPASPDYPTAARLFGYLDARLNSVAPEEYGLRREYDRAREVLRTKLGSRDLALLAAAGASMTEDEALARATR
jgi:predicted ATPase/transcriptional regulator with XRE-family HTH domain